MAVIPPVEGTVQQEGTVTTGKVVAANNRGFQLHGMESWLNWSKFAPEPRTYPAVGHTIVASLDNDGYVRQVVIGDGKAAKERVTERVVEAVPPEEMTPYNGGYTAVATGRAQAARNPQLDREFRLRCLTVAIDSFSSLAESAADFELATLRANLIGAWAEGRTE